MKVIIVKEILAMKQLLRTIAEALVDKPEEVDITAMISNSTYVLELRVAKEDVGKIIGRKGRTVDSIRTILRGTAMKQNKRLLLEVID
jgi:predicted RNA-binding protein YlqC (UPF0109 family)